jgi:methionine synthase I (cobalamin-dependent)
MVFDSGRAKDRTSMGVTVEQAVAGLTAAGADVLGANCGQGIESFIEVCRRLRSATSRPIWIKANAGLPVLVNGRAVYKTTPEAFAQAAPDLLGAGANFIGGCCGTSPQFIQSLRQKLRA